MKSDLRKALKAQRSVLEKELHLEPGQGAFFLNGLDMGSMESIDMFSLSTTLSQEAKLLDAFARLSKPTLTNEQVKELIYLADSAKDAGGSNSDYGIDIRDSSVQWLNDLEHDSKYAYWTKDMQEILRPT